MIIFEPKGVEKPLPPAGTLQLWDPDCSFGYCYPTAIYDPDLLREKLKLRLNGEAPEGLEWHPIEGFEGEQIYQNDVVHAYVTVFNQASVKRNYEIKIEVYGFSGEELLALPSQEIQVPSGGMEHKSIFLPLSDLSQFSAEQNPLRIVITLFQGGKIQDFVSIPLEIVVGYPTSCYDFDSSGQVDVADIMLVADCWRMTDEDPDCAPYELNGDGIITVVDIMLVAAHWGEPCE